MIHLLDTHALVAFLGDEHARLGRWARRILERASHGGEDVRTSVISIWEVSILLEKGRVRLGAGWPAWLAALQRAPSLRVEPLLLEDVEHARAFPSLVDPSDRFVVGTALRLGATLITGDERITRSRTVPVLW